MAGDEISDEEIGAVEDDDHTYDEGGLETAEDDDHKDDDRLEDSEEALLELGGTDVKARVDDGLEEAKWLPCAIELVSCDELVDGSRLERAELEVAEVAPRTDEVAELLCDEELEINHCDELDDWTELEDVAGPDVKSRLLELLVSS